MKLELRNLGVHRRLSLELSRVNALLGPSRSGKSSAALALALLFAEPRETGPEALITAGEDEAEVRFWPGEGMAVRALITRKPPKIELALWRDGEKLEGERVREVLREKFGLSGELQARYLLSPNPSPSLRRAALAQAVGSKGAANPVRLKRLKAALLGLSELRRGRCPCLATKCPARPPEEVVEERAFQILKKIEQMKEARGQERPEVLEELRRLLEAFGVPAKVEGSARVVPTAVLSRRDERLLDAAHKLALVRATGAQAVVLDGLEDLTKRDRAALLKMVYASGAFTLLLARSETPPARTHRYDLKTIFLAEVRDAA